MLRLRLQQLLRLARAAWGQELSAAERGLALLATQQLGLACVFAYPQANGYLLQHHQQQLTRIPPWQQQRSLQAPQQLWRTCSSEHFTSAATYTSSSVDESTSYEQQAASASARPRDMAIVFTCGKCDTRSMKAFTRQAYEHGLVLITCPGCQAMHLIADHLGWFGDTGFKIDEFLASQGQQVKRVTVDSHQHTTGSSENSQQQQGQQALTAEDIAGWSKVQQLLSTVATAAGGSSKALGESCGALGHSNGHMDQHQQHGQLSNISESNSAGEGPNSIVAFEKAAAAAAGGDGGVVDVSPEDMEGWSRVQQQQQLQR